MGIFTAKTIVITGASEGIGRALALQLAPQNPHLVLAARTESRLDEVVDQCKQLGAEAIAEVADVTDERQCAELIDGAIEAFGKLDVIVNNVGGTMWANLDDVEDLSIYEYLMRLNYMSSVWCTYYALPHLKETKGLIVGVSSIAGMVGVPTRTGYSATKHAQFGFFDSLRIELDGTGVDVTMIAPDFVKTEIHKRALKGDGTPLKETPLQEKQIMTSEQCAEIIVGAMEKRRRLLICSTRGVLGRWIRLVAPKWMDNIAKKAIETGK
ncbi:MAG: SDR family oxidoreductase [Candidatus Hydrogenedentota bacterium]